MEGSGSGEARVWAVKADTSSLAHGCDMGALTMGGSLLALATDMSF